MYPHILTTIEQPLTEREPSGDESENGEIAVKDESGWRNSPERYFL